MRQRIVVLGAGEILDGQLRRRAAQTRQQRADNLGSACHSGTPSRGKRDARRPRSDCRPAGVACRMWRRMQQRGGGFLVAAVSKCGTDIALTPVIRLARGGNGTMASIRTTSTRSAHAGTTSQQGTGTAGRPDRPHHGGTAPAGEHRGQAGGKDRPRDHPAHGPALGRPERLFPAGKSSKSAERDRQILAEFNGANHASLAQKHGISVQWVYKIIKNARSAS
ncbi:Uncharacterized conserved protein [Chromobacterium violaceum]|uniref:Uncharacterized conserved protein n=1 Tax=Chromobacterium violaceum TaxID=536 RepID=A0A447T5I6_CHRVL|nr:Uncharacterized conserved protein [Chromobacterium violaceum]